MLVVSLVRHSHCVAQNWAVFAPKIYPTVETTVKNSAERDSFPFIGALGFTDFDVPATQKRAQRNQITRKLATSKFANWILCFCHIRVLAMGRFN
jgi:hypothetical protein